MLCAVMTPAAIWLAFVMSGGIYFTFVCNPIFLLYNIHHFLNKSSMSLFVIKSPCFSWHSTRADPCIPHRGQSTIWTHIPSILMTRVPKFPQLKHLYLNSS